ncbi:hypothetical protein [Tropheryma whipplei]|uniref:Uncharacterized protein n=1 Tax=Tropheryma whipplei (strain Twist) TaxID=203267 RepID=Q83H40_TROWT|nr:hypothetical protein [Tropheryma whipplei]AAO44119.1 unknown [Tropheryma whipplei str. Twist]MCO8182832.1 hypothetical protein [Tropheryma whipplei]MCO8190490.1 hypothetical protein [Tropheryma whipplei]CAD66715.1 putative integral membrane protein [Tropheryma whipplei TW08/27]
MWRKLASVPALIIYLAFVPVLTVAAEIYVLTGYSLPWLGIPAFALVIITINSGLLPNRDVSPSRLARLAVYLALAALIVFVVVCMTIYFTVGLSRLARFDVLAPFVLGYLLASALSVELCYKLKAKKSGKV